jgi:hypothetical protein
VHGNAVGAAPREDLDFRHQARSDPVAHQIRESLLHVKRLADAANMASLVFHADQQCPAGGADGGDDRRVPGPSPRADCLGLRAPIVLSCADRGDIVETGLRARVHTEV